MASADGRSLFTPCPFHLRFLSCCLGPAYGLGVEDIAEGTQLSTTGLLLARYKLGLHKVKDGLEKARVPVWVLDAGR